MSFIFNKIKSSINNGLQFDFVKSYLPSGFNAKPIEFNQNFCVSFQYGTYNLSYDGISYFQIQNNNIKYPADSTVSPNGRIYVLSNESSDDYILGLSTGGGVQYTNSPGKNSQYIAASDTNILIGNSLGIYSQIGNWALKLSQSNLTGMIYCLNKYFIFYISSEQVFYKTSTDGNVWSNAIRIAEGANVTSVRYINNKLIIVVNFVNSQAKRDYSFYESVNGIDWTKTQIAIVSPPPSYGFPEILDIAYGNNTYFTLLASPGPTPMFSYLTKNINSNTWIQSSETNARDGEYLVFYKNKFTTSPAENSYGRTISLSRNKDTNFTIQSNLNFFKKLGNESDVFFYNGIFLSYNATKLKYSTDGNSWIDIENEITQGSALIKNIVYENNVFALLLDDGRIFYSNNGITWSFSDIIVFSNGIFSINSANGNFIIQYAFRNPTTQTLEFFIKTSSDAINWSASTQTSQYLTKIVGNNNIYVGGESSSNYIYKLLYSNNLINWTNVVISNIGFVTSLTYNGGKFIASTIINPSDNPLNAPTNQILYSDNGITWTKRQLPLNTTDSYLMSKINYSNNKFYCFYDEGNYYAYSNDLLNWTYDKIPFTCSKYFNPIFYNNQTIVYGNTFANENTLKFVN